MENNDNQFGMSQEEEKAVARNQIWLNVKTVFASIEPAVAKVINSIIYYSIRLIKAFVEASIRMLMGKEV